MAVSAATLERRARSRAAHYRQRYDQASTPRKRLWVACGWLVAEAWRAGCIDQVTGAVWQMARNISMGRPATVGDRRGPSPGAADPYR